MKYYIETKEGKVFQFYAVLYKENSGIIRISGGTEKIKDGAYLAKYNGEEWRLFLIRWQLQHPKRAYVFRTKDSNLIVDFLDIDINLNDVRNIWEELD